MSCRCFISPLLRELGLLGLALVLLTSAGCSEPMPPEHTAAISKMQGVGAKVMFDRGGYSLNFRQSRLEDTDLKSLHDIQDLTVLDIRDTRVTDKGLEDIAKLPKLVEIWLHGTMTTPEGVDALKKARPEIEVH